MPNLRSASLAATAILLAAGCGGTPVGGEDGAIAAPDLTRAVAADLSRAADLAAAPDLAARVDLAPGADLAVAADLAVPADDLAVASDLASAPDLVVADDLAAPPDLVVAPDFGCAAGAAGCVACGGDGDCRTDGGVAGLAVCDTTAHRCVACLADGDCAAGTICQGQRCVAGCNAGHGCAGADACCAGACFDLTSSALHCGGCNFACNAGRNTTCCASACVDTGSDFTNCGGCGDACSSNHASPSCAGGACTSPCELGYADCDSDLLGTGCETHVATDVGNCGGCGVTCSTRNKQNTFCSGGACQGTCDIGFADCDSDLQANGCETNTTSNDAANCGGCNMPCSTNNIQVGPGSPTCVATQCAGTCAFGYRDCDGDMRTNGCEAHLADDSNNCGACGVVCSMQNLQNSLCGGGRCAGTCKSGFDDCDNNLQNNGCETDLTTTSNCGGCNIVCSTFHVLGSACVNTQCAGTCEAGYQDCDGNLQATGCEAHLADDSRNCGACGAVCGPGLFCAGGTCQ